MCVGVCVGGRVVVIQVFANFIKIAIEVFLIVTV